MGTRRCCDGHAVKFTTTTRLFLQLVTHFSSSNCYKAAPGHGVIRLTGMGFRMDFLQVMVPVSWKRQPWEQSPQTCWYTGQLRPEQNGEKAMPSAVRPGKGGFSLHFATSFTPFYSFTYCFLSAVRGKPSIRHFQTKLVVSETWTFFFFSISDQEQCTGQTL